MNATLIRANSRLKRSKPQIETNQQIQSTSNAGPLFTIAQALFGEGSFLQNRLEHPQAYELSENATTGKIGCSSDYV
jgi:hypothetical protein